MQEETIAYVTQMLKDNRPARELIDSDWTMMNDSPRGITAMKVLPTRSAQDQGADDPRGGGLLGNGHQSMLTWMATTG